jgi:hypothetical protein
VGAGIDTVRFRQNQIDRKSAECGRCHALSSRHASLGRSGLGHGYRVSGNHSDHPSRVAMALGRARRSRSAKKNPRRSGGSLRKSCAGLPDCTIQRLIPASPAVNQRAAATGFGGYQATRCALAARRVARSTARRCCRLAARSISAARCAAAGIPSRASCSNFFRIAASFAFLLMSRWPV